MEKIGSIFFRVGEGKRRGHALLCEWGAQALASRTKIKSIFFRVGESKRRGHALLCDWEAQPLTSLKILDQSFSELVRVKEEGMKPLQDYAFNGLEPRLVLKTFLALICIFVASSYSIPDFFLALRFLFFG